LLKEGGAEVVAASSIYETEPVDYPDQPWFLNQVLEIRSELDPPSLLRTARSIEAALKRAPTVPKGPRTIDIDILFAGGLVVDSPGLSSPPRLHLRNLSHSPGEIARTSTRSSANHLELAGLLRSGAVIGSPLAGSSGRSREENARPDV
jgi:2-amino-4-hydroxy-6-hydroxymethyldihydropteridine diphosphokinase